MDNKLEDIFGFINDSDTYDVKSVFCQKCNISHDLIKGLDMPFYWCGNEMFQLSPGDIVAMIDDEDN